MTGPGRDATSVKAEQRHDPAANTFIPAGSLGRRIQQVGVVDLHCVPADTRTRHVGATPHDMGVWETELFAESFAFARGASGGGGRLALRPSSSWPCAPVSRNKYFLRILHSPSCPDLEHDCLGCDCFDESELSPSRTESGESSTWRKENYDHRVHASRARVGATACTWLVVHLSKQRSTAAVPGPLQKTLSFAGLAKHMIKLRARQLLLPKSHPFRTLPRAALARTGCPVLRGGMRPSLKDCHV